MSAWWIALTQWFFGPALIDRGFTITGGACELAEHFEGTGGKREFVTGQACKIAGGQWKGGHDISGHVFILVLGGAFLGMEVLPVLLQRMGIKDERVVKKEDGGFSGIEAVAVADSRPEGEADRFTAKIGLWAPLIVMGLNCFMLFMTAAYFHTWFEKVCLNSTKQRGLLEANIAQSTGLLVASSALFTVFYLPRAIPAVRDVVGLPGI